MDWPKAIFADPTAIESTLAIFAIVIALGLAVRLVGISLFILATYVTYDAATALY